MRLFWHICGQYVAVCCMQWWFSVLQCIRTRNSSLHLYRKIPRNLKFYIIHQSRRHERVRERTPLIAKWHLGGPLTNSLMTKWSMDEVSLVERSTNCKTIASSFPRTTAIPTCFYRLVWFFSPTVLTMKRPASLWPSCPPASGPLACYEHVQKNLKCLDRPCAALCKLSEKLKWDECIGRNALFWSVQLRSTRGRRFRRAAPSPVVWYGEIKHPYPGVLHIRLSSVLSNRTAKPDIWKRFSFCEEVVHNVFTAFRIVL